MAGAHPLKATDYQDPDDPARAAAEAAQASLAALISAAWQSISDNLDVAAIAALLSAGGWMAVRALVTPDQLTEAMRPVTTALINLQDDVAAAAMAEEVAEAAAAVPPASSSLAPVGLLTFQPGPASPLGPVSFDPVEPALIADQQEMAAAFVQRLSTTAEAVIDQTIRLGMTNAATADEIAQTIKTSIGLTPRQAMAVENFRLLLEKGDAGALTRTLRDRRFDGTVQRAIDGDALSDAQIDRMVERYTERSLAYRANMIAKTEALTAANAGRRAAWSQFADRRGIGQSGIIRFWQTATDERVCPVCSAIPLMNPDGTPMNEPYDTPNGSEAMAPIHPACRCTERYQIATRQPARA